MDDSDAAALAAAAYKDRKTGLTDLAGLAGWTILDQANEKGGYDAVVVHHPASNVLVIANRGTEGFRSFDDWRANVEAALEKDPRRQVIPALTFVDRVAKASQAAGLAPRELLIVGHSLGGALADIQGAFAKAIWPTAPPVRVVGIASAGFANSVAAYAALQGWTPAATAPAFITHYARGKDAVPHHPKRKVFGTDRPIASIWQCYEELPSKGGAPTYWADTDFLRNHDVTLYWRHLAIPNSTSGTAASPRPSPPRRGPIRAGRTRRAGRRISRACSARADDRGFCP
ncbi:hypothetical protein [Caulobacter sp. 1776]|uniref:lipase family protein n=1 Tax=Caulobacter sp. 1776 TaxID=3156420 RepID=UPI0033972043